MKEEVYLHGVHVHAEVALRRPRHVLVTLLSQHYKQSRVTDPNPGVLVEIGSVFVWCLVFKHRSKIPLKSNRILFFLAFGSVPTILRQS